MESDFSVIDFVTLGYIYSLGLQLYRIHLHNRNKPTLHINIPSQDGE